MNWSQTAIDSKFNVLSDDEVEFLKMQTGIKELDALTRHVACVASKAMEVHPYTCLLLNFLKFKLTNLPAYKRVLKMSSTVPRAIFLDVGCCLGQDVRKAVADGFPPSNIIATDLRPEFWTLGHELFRSTPETFPVAFVPGNILDPRFLAEETNYRRSLPPLSTLRSLTPLQGHVSAIHASSIFHLFSGPEQVVLAKKLSALLSPSTGSVIFGIQQGDVVAGEIVNPRRERVYLHSLESWKSLWKALFPEGGVQVEANWLESIETGTRARVLVMAWSVTRL